MAAPSYVFTIGRVAKILGQDEVLLYDLAVDMEPEEGCLTVIATDDLSTVAFTSVGIENLKLLVEEAGK